MAKKQKGKAYKAPAGEPLPMPAQMASQLTQGGPKNHPHDNPVHNVPDPTHPFWEDELPVGSQPSGYM